MNVERPLIRRLIWDAWNLEHIGKHLVQVEEIELLVRRSDWIYKDTYKNRYLVIGQLSQARVLTIVVGLTPRSRDEYYVFSARPSSAKEKRWLREEEGGIADDEIVN
ncbi:MAG: hypothetical protein ACRDHN_14285 [Thermomicrobiales bacterium]